VDLARLLGYSVTRLLDYSATRLLGCSTTRLLDYSTTRLLVYSSTRLLVYFRMLTARAATSATVTSDAKDWTIISNLAQLVRGIVSVGLNAVAFVKDT